MKNWKQKYVQIQKQFRAKLAINPINAGQNVKNAIRTKII